MNGADIGMLAAFRRERMAYVLLLCLCLSVQAGFSAIAAVVGDRQAVLALVLCDGSLPENPSQDPAAGGHPCLSGACALAGCGAAALFSSDEPSFAFLADMPNGWPTVSPVAFDRTGKIPIRGPPPRP